MLYIRFQFTLGIKENERFKMVNVTQITNISGAQLLVIGTKKAQKKGDDGERKILAQLLVTT